jgi:hypothetical protein
MRESLDSSLVLPSFRGALFVRLVVLGAIIIIVPLIALFLLCALSFLVLVFDPVACISAADDITQVAIVLTMPSAALLRWSDTAGRIPIGTLPVVKLQTPVSVLTVMDWICHNYYVQHHLEELDMRVDLFIIFW